MPVDEKLLASGDKLTRLTAYRDKDLTFHQSTFSGGQANVLAVGGDQNITVARTIEIYHTVTKLGYDFTKSRGGARDHC